MRDITFPYSYDSGPYFTYVYVDIVFSRRDMATKVYELVN